MCRTSGRVRRRGRTDRALPPTSRGTVFHLTGTDEHGLKIQRTADSAAWTRESGSDELEPKWREVWASLDIAYDDYIRTTEPRHTAAVPKSCRRSTTTAATTSTWVTTRACTALVRGLLHRGNWSTGLCPIPERPLEMMRETTASSGSRRYADRLIEHYEAASRAVEPAIRRNEVLSLIRGGLQDFSIGRTRSTGGSRCRGTRPGLYVWFDALELHHRRGYVDDPDASTVVARGHPLIGKDLIRFHAVYWPAMLMAAGGEPPTQVWAHGLLTVGGQKIRSRTLTGIHPFELLDHSASTPTLLLHAESRSAPTASFSGESMTGRCNAASRTGSGTSPAGVLAMLDTSFGGAVPDPGAAGSAAADDLPTVVAEAAAGGFDERMLDVASVSRRWPSFSEDRRARQRLPGREGALEAGQGPEPTKTSWPACCTLAAETLL